MTSTSTGTSKVVCSPAALREIGIRLRLEARSLRVNMLVSAPRFLCLGVFVAFVALAYLPAPALAKEKDYYEGECAPRAKHCTRENVLSGVMLTAVRLRGSVGGESGGDRCGN